MVDAATRPPSAAIAELRERFAGELIASGDAGYDDARRLWNAVFDRRPALIVRPTTSDDVAAAIRFGREQDLAIAVRAGGHSAAGHSGCDGGLVIDLSALRGVTVDPAARRARANGGALLRELDTAAQAHGLVCPVGVVGHTGVGGLTLGGGIGRLMRKWGLTIDNLLGVELVTADGDLVRASRTEEPDLFWGIRGAGPNFGVVTAFEFGLQRFDGQLSRGIRIYDTKVIHEVWPIVRELSRTASDDLALTFGVGQARSVGLDPEATEAGSIFYVSFNHCGDPGRVERDLSPLDAAPGPLVTTPSRVSYLEIQGANDDAMGFGQRSAISGGFANDVRLETLDAIVDHVEAGDPEATIAFTALGGAVGRIDEASTPFTGRSAVLEFSADTSWTDPALDEERRAWVHRAMAILAGDAVTGRYVNEIAESGPDETRSIYGDATYAKLARLKRVWDPDNVFRLNHNVEPASG